jgi:hypothetical protein
MKKVLSFIILMVCAVTGAWADSETTLNVGSNGSTVRYGDRWGGQLFAILTSQNENDFAEWYYSDANTGQLDSYLSILRLSSGSAKIPLTGGSPSYPNSYIKLSGNSEWDTPSIEIYIDANDSQSALAVWLINTRNSNLFKCADMAKLTINGQNPHWNYENGSNKGVITLKKGSDGKFYFDIAVENGSATALFNSFVSDNSMFSSIPGRIYINDANTSYIDLAGTSATVTSANENDFATWVANHSDALSSVTNYTFNGDAKFTTDGDANYVVINGNTATATCTDNSTSLHTWANANSAYLNGVQTVNFTSETTIYMTDPADETKRVVVNVNNVTVYCEDVDDYNSWKNNSLNSKIINGKTVKTVGMKMKLSDGCYIEFSEDGKKAYVHAQHEGCLTSLYDTYIAPYGSPNTSSFPDGTILVFGNDCVLSSSDVTKVLGGGTDQWKLSFDFFDVTNNGQMTVAAIDAAIEAGVNSMASSYKSQYGIILPYNSTIGTSKMIRSNGNTGGDGSTFTKYAAYYRESETAKNLTLHVWDKQYWNSWGSISANNYAEAVAQLNTHNEVKNAETVTVSTLTNTSFDLSKLDASKVKIEITNDDMIQDVWNQSAPNTNIPSLADVYVVSSVPGGFNSNVETTGTKATPTNLLKISGQISSSDLAAISDFTDGPRVLDLSAATGVTPAYVSAITNNKIEYVILPNGWEKDYVNAAANITNMPNLKTAISTSSDQKELVAYVNVAGTLAAARCLATGIAAGSTFPDKKGLTSVILSGNLNAADINAQGKVGTDGHWTTSSNQAAGLNQEQATITSIDLEKAVFANQEDMNFYKAGFEGLTNVVLPTSEAMTLIPEDCLNNNHSLEEICIPYNYQIIRSGAFNGTAVDHITTTDASGALIDNGDHTWTLSANITELGSVPSEPGAFVNQVFQHDLLVTDIYILATKAPKCYAGVFPANASYGYGGATGSATYCRDKYFNSDDRLSKAWIVLRFPSEASYNAAKAAGQATDATYEEMKANYTDPTRVYTKKEQTGAVDANGDAIVWPTRQEANRSYNQGSRGLTWKAWDTTSGTSSQGEEGAIAGGAEPKGAATGSKATNDGMPTTTSGYTFNADYMGWHQIALAMATYYEPAEVIENEKIVREYEEAGWYTFCIPFNMSYKQVVEMLGVPKSTENVINKLNGEEVTGDIMPDIRQLSSVTRKKGEGKNNNIVMLRMTNNLWEVQTPGYTSYLQITHNENSETHQLVTAEPYNASSTIDDRLSLIGGRPYIIKAYKRKQVVDGVDQFKIKGQNIGKFILERYADQFGIESSIVKNDKYESYLCYEQLGGGTLQSLRFAKPYEDHRVQAVRDGEDGAYLTYETDENGNTVTKKYYYTMVGQFWQQPLPQYCLYMSKGNWYRYTNVPENIEDRYTWDPYKCIIMATEEVTGTKGAGYRDDSKSNYPEPKAGTTDLLESDFYLGFLDGRDDDDFGEKGTSARYIFSLDDDIVEFDEEGNEVTAIQRLDGEVVAPANVKVYNVAGQYVGESLNGLTKGLYIVNGKKIVVK